MHGHGYAPPTPKPPSTGVLVVLRVIFVAIALLSIGFLAWVAPLRAAIVTRRPADWWFFGGTLVVLGTSFALIGTDDTDDLSTPNGTAGMIILLLNAAACVAHYLYADIRHFHRLHRAHAVQPPMTPAYGYPQPAPPFTATAAPGMPQPPYTAPPMPYAPVPQQPVPTPAPPPHTPAPARIDQVRAELDELSDYLRRHDGNGNGNHESAR
ncbi:hypothetical protein ACIRFH_12785 [Streptomyces sp. NPDC093586]|uniref:hypothetical protein n=1 Tax=Streptomyces sp. NPDC093586 TaxID=3366042 RepID=UPI00381E24F8